MTKRRIPESELILNKDGTIFHLHLKPEMVSDIIILVGDQDRVGVISNFFDEIEYKVKNREFVTHTGIYKGRRMSIVSTGIGTDNIDIVINELDALFNVNLETREEKEIKTKLNFIRIGTSGSLQEDILVDEPIVSEYAIGFDNVLNFYEGRNNICNLEMEKEFIEYTKWNPLLSAPYFIKSSEKLLKIVGEDIKKGITITSSGFYGPQGRVIRLKTADMDLNDKISTFKYKNYKITNYEMETSAIYGLSKLLGHNALTICQIIANRISKEYSNNYREVMMELFVKILNRLVLL